MGIPFPILVTQRYGVINPRNNEEAMIGKKNIQILVLSILCISIEACLSDLKPEVGIQPTLKPTIELIEPTIPNVPPNELTIQEVERIIDDKDYMNGCQGIYPPPPKNQVDFKGIFPGVSSVATLIDNLGEPYTYTQFNNIDNYRYSNESSDFIYEFSSFDDIIDGITILKGKELANVQVLLNTFGCPNLIVANKLDEHYDEDKTYDAITFLYLEGGIQIGFDKYPLHISDTPRSVWFNPPSDIESYVFSANDFTPIPFSVALPDF